MASESLVITILNWEKYQGKAKDFKSTTWFRLDNRFCEHGLWQQLNPSQLKYYFFLLMFVSRNAHTSGQISTSIVYQARQSGVRSCTVRTTLEHLVTHGVVQIQTLNNASRTAQASLRNGTERNETGTDRKEPLFVLPEEMKRKFDLAKTGHMAWYANAQEH